MLMVGLLVLWRDAVAHLGDSSAPQDLRLLPAQ